MSLINALMMGVVTPQQFGAPASQSLASVYPYRYYSLYLPGTQSGFTRCTRFRLFDDTGTNVAASATVTDTVHYGSESGDKATDNNDADQWTMENGVNGRVVVDFGAPQAIRDFYVGFSTYPNSGNGFRIQGSDDGSTWTTLYDSELFYDGNTPGWPTATPRRVKNVNRIYEIVFDGTQSAGFFDIGWLDLLDGDDNSILDDTTIMEHIDINNAYSGSPGAEYWGNITDRDTSTRGTFNISTDDLRVALRVKDAKAKTLSLTRATTGGNPMPTAFTVRYSEDGGTSWSDIYSTSGLSWSSGETKTFTLDDYSSPWISLSSGSGYVGSVFRTVGTGGQWYNGSFPISGETGETITITIDLEGANLRYVNGGGVSNAIQMWMPTDATATIVEWWDAMDTDNLALTGALVDSWTGRVNGVVASASGSQRPTYSATARNSLPGITGTGTQWLTFSSAGFPNHNDAIDFGGVGYYGGTPSGFMHWGDFTNGERRAIGRGNATPYITFYGYGASYDFTSNVDWGSNDRFVMVDLAAGTNPAVVIRSDGITLRSGSVSTLGLWTGTTGAILGDGAGGGWVGTMQMAIVYADGLASGDRQKLEGMVCHRFGIASRLDAGHPYKSAAPRVLG